MNLKNIFVAASMAMAALSASATPIQWSSGTGANGHYYEYIATATNWTTARANALASNYLGMQGYLATVTSANETTFLLGVTTSISWIGGSDEWDSSSEADQNIWKWMDGPEAGQIFWNNGAVPGQYANWNSGEPNNCCGGEDYLQFAWGSAGRWNDHGGPGNPGQLNGYLVEYSGNAVPEPGSLALLGLGLAALAGRRRRAV